VSKEIYYIEEKGEGVTFSLERKREKQATKMTLRLYGPTWTTSSQGEVAASFQISDWGHADLYLPSIGKTVRLSPLELCHLNIALKAYEKIEGDGSWFNKIRLWRRPKLP
jgi:hypothetical protein